MIFFTSSWKIFSSDQVYSDVANSTCFSVSSVCHVLFDFVTRGCRLPTSWVSSSLADQWSGADYTEGLYNCFKHWPAPTERALLYQLLIDWVVLRKQRVFHPGCRCSWVFSYTVIQEDLLKTDALNPATDQAPSEKPGRGSWLEAQSLQTQPFVSLVRAAPTASCKPRGNQFPDSERVTKFLIGERKQTFPFQTDFALSVMIQSRKWAN